MRVANVTDIVWVGSTLLGAFRAGGVDADLVDPIRLGREVRYPWKAAVLPLRAAGLLSAAARVRCGDLDLVDVHYTRQGPTVPLCGPRNLVGWNPRSTLADALASLWRGSRW